MDGGKIAYNKEHCVDTGDPTIQDTFHPWHIQDSGAGDVEEEPWMVQLPKKYGISLTRSSLNKTILPGEFLQTWHIIILIRHSALMFASSLGQMLPLVSSKSPTWTS